jgi:hypothetical protein
LAGVISQVCGLVIRQHVSEPFTRYCFAVRRRTRFLQASQGLRTKSVAKLSVEALERVEVLCVIERDSVDCPGVPVRQSWASARRSGGCADATHFQFAGA